MILIRYAIYYFIFTIVYAQPNDSPLLEKLILQMDTHFHDVVSNSEKYKLQIVYTQINRDKNNYPKFETHYYNYNPKEYFYPASTIKFPIAVLALEKINSIQEINQNTSLSILDGPYDLDGVVKDSTSFSGFPTIAHYIHKLFVVSDNDASNRLFEFLGRDYINKRLWDLGFVDARIRHRLNISLTDQQNCFTNSFLFYNNDELIYEQNSQLANLNLDINYNNYILGKAFINNEKKINVPFDFSAKNFMNIGEQHRFLQLIMFPEIQKNNTLLNLSDEDYQYIYNKMSLLPRESLFPKYDDYNQYYDGYCKFLLFGDNKKKIPSSIRIFNKIGQAYGFSIDNAYILDFENRVEFLLSVVIYTNQNETFNDDIYEYNELSIPFLARFGKKIYEYELLRPKKNLPDLTRYNLGSW
tara:strand:+ start:155 stop:1393 length:1239 start_codon:yes stop_codon:yes gene_type:complete